jgi:hypothetical protein
MYVHGASITVDQAKEVIRRSDLWFRGLYGSDNARFKKLAVDFGFKPLDGYSSEEFWAAMNRREQWQKEWGLLEAEYLFTDWICSSYIGGPNGWCNPDGTIYSFHNVGKWPSPEGLIRDWKRVAEAFPFLTLTAVIGDRECHEKDISPVMQIEVANGSVHSVYPRRELFPMYKETAITDVQNWPSCGISEEWLQEWAAKSRGILTRLGG